MINKRNFFKRGFSLLSAVALFNSTTLLGSAAKAKSIKDRCKTNTFYIFSIFILFGLLQGFVRWLLRNNIFTENKKKDESCFSKGTAEDTRADWYGDEVEKRTISNENPPLLSDSALPNGTTSPDSVVKSDSLKSRYKNNVFYIFLMFFLTGLSIYFIRWWTRNNNVLTENKKKIESYFSKAKVKRVRNEWNSKECTKRTIGYEISPSESIIFELFEESGRFELGCSLKKSDNKKSIKDSSEELRHYHLNYYAYDYKDSCDALEDIKRTEFVSSVFNKLQKFNGSKDYLCLDLSKKTISVNFFGKSLKISSISIVPVVPINTQKGCAADFLVCCGPEKSGSEDYMLTDHLLESRGGGNKLKIEEMQILVNKIVSELSENKETNEEKLNTSKIVDDI